jgi:hypothetical protein
VKERGRSRRRRRRRRSGRRRKSKTIKNKKFKLPYRRTKNVDDVLLPLTRVE